MFERGYRTEVSLEVLLRGDDDDVCGTVSMDWECSQELQEKTLQPVVC